MSESASVSPLELTIPVVEKTVNKTVIRLQHGDLTAMKVDAFVLYAREDLDIGSGYGTAILMRGGPAIKKDLDQIGSIQMGEAVITGAGEMNAGHIIHACGPKFQEQELESKLLSCMMSSLKVADKAGIKTLAFPPMGTGFYGVALDVSARVMFDSIVNFVQSDTSLEQVIICVNDSRDYGPFKARFESL